MNDGDSGSAVTAVADTGYHFVSWSDGNTNASRTDTNVTVDKSVTASFAIDAPTTHTLTYTAGLHGTISGTSPQTVNNGDNGSEVTAVADTGYHFVSWSDGNSNASRTDTNVTGDIIVRANFAIDAAESTEISVTGVSALENINVEFGTAKSNIGLPETVDVDLSNNTTTSAAVTWNNGSPTYDGDIAGTYKFKGTLQLLDTILNPDNLKASVNVVVGSENVTTGAAVTVSINGTAKAGNTLKSTVVDEKGNDLSSNAEYIWYRVTSANGDEDGEKIGTDKTYVVRSSDIGYYIKLVVTYDGKTYKDVTAKTTSSTSSSSSHKSSSSSSSSRSSEQITVKVTYGTSTNSVSQTVITKTTASDGTKTDTVTYTADKAKETIQQE